MLLLLFIINVGKLLKLSKCVLTSARGWPNLRSKVLSASSVRLSRTPPAFERGGVLDTELPAEQ